MSENYAKNTGLLLKAGRYLLLRILVTVFVTVGFLAVLCSFAGSLG